MNILDEFGKFTWFWNDNFFIETKHGNYIWSDPDYNGDNTIRKTDMNIKQFCKYCGVGFGRSKGLHVIRNYTSDCGEPTVIE